MILSASLAAHPWFACASASAIPLTSASCVSGAGGGAVLHAVIENARTVAAQRVARVFIVIFLLRGIPENVGTMALPAEKRQSGCEFRQQPFCHNSRRIG